MNKRINEASVIKRLIELSKEISKHNHLYHNLDRPKISDSQYDKLIKENNLLENKYPHLTLKNSPNKFIGAKVKILVRCFHWGMRLIEMT